MDNLQTEVLEIEFLAYSKGLTTISEEDFARILLRYTTVDNISSYLENVHQSIPDEKVKVSALLMTSTSTLQLTKAECPLDQHTLDVSHYCNIASLVFKSSVRGAIPGVSLQNSHFLPDLSFISTKMYFTI